MGQLETFLICVNGASFSTALGHWNFVIILSLQADRTYIDVKTLCVLLVDLTNMGQIWIIY